MPAPFASIYQSSKKGASGTASAHGGPGTAQGERSPQRAKPYFLISETTDPFENIASEETLMHAVQPGEYLLFLWQNANTIVIGRNQSAWKECRVAEFEEDGGTIARRLSGGGAVFHDIGNLNFTFIAADSEYDLAMNMRVICEAVRSFGLEAELSGRNDATIDAAKFSGNAFYRTNGQRCHHGTLMIDVDTAKLARYLQPDAKKLAAKGVDSVRSRVVNLSELCSRITVETLSIALIEALSDACGTPALPFPPDRIDAADVESRTKRLSSWEWRFGKAIPFTHAFAERYAWGNLDIELAVNRGVIEQARISSDALDADFVVQVADALVGCRYDCTSVEHRLHALETETDEQRMMASDCAELIRGGFYV